jgi:hypothetical protein
LIRNQEGKDKRLDQLKMRKGPPKGGLKNVRAALAAAFNLL